MFRGESDVSKNSDEMDEESIPQFEMYDDQYNLQMTSNATSNNFTTNRSFDSAFESQKQAAKQGTNSDSDYFLTFLNFNISNKDPNRIGKDGFEIEMKTSLTMMEEEICEKRTPNSSDISWNSEMGSRKTSREKKKKKHPKQQSAKVSEPDADSMMIERMQLEEYKKDIEEQDYEQQVAYSEEYQKEEAPMKEERLSEVFCNCSKTKCIKKYCTCFSKGLACGPYCHCKGCENTTDRETELSQVEIEQLRKGQLIEDTCCNCKMSQCEKSYCTCARNKKGCSLKCTCYNCKNSFGTSHKQE